MAQKILSKVYAACVVTSSLIAIAHAYPEGPPLNACRDMQPRTQMGELGLEGHTTRPQNEYPTEGRPAIPPYHIIIHPMPIHYEPGGQYNVYVVADQVHGANFYKGILMQARKVTCYDNTTIGVENDALGSFTINPDRDLTLLQTMDCNDDPASAVSHKSRQYKINETATWHAPDSYVGHIAFYATIVQEDVVYWMGAHSAVMTDPNSSPPPSCKSCKTIDVSSKTIIGLLIAQMCYTLFAHR